MCEISNFKFPILNREDGFSLIEIVIVMALLAIIGGLALIMNFDDYRGYSFRNERDLLVSVLQRARSQSVNNVCLSGLSCTGGQPHGVHIGSAADCSAINKPCYVIFQTTTTTPTFAARDTAVDQDIERSSSFNLVTSPGPDVVFDQLSGNVDIAPWSLVVTDNLNHIATTTVNSQGQIDW